MRHRVLPLTARCGHVSKLRIRPSATVCKRPLSGELLPYLIIGADGFVSRRPQTKPRRVAEVCLQARRLLLCTPRRVPNLRRSFDA
jgi:hypothetical protein